MTKETADRPRSTTKHPKTTPRRYESDTLAMQIVSDLQSLRLIAAPNPKDDLSKEDLIQLGKRSGQSLERQSMIQQIIEYIKTI